MKNVKKYMKRSVPLTWVDVLTFFGGGGLALALNWAVKTYGGDSPIVQNIRNYSKYLKMVAGGAGATMSKNRALQFAAAGFGTVGAVEALISSPVTQQFFSIDGYGADEFLRIGASQNYDGFDVLAGTIGASAEDDDFMISGEGDMEDVMISGDMDFAFS